MAVSLGDQIILVVDDEESSRAMVRQMLRRIGFGEVLVAPDGFRAMEIINERKVNAVLTDFRMPGMHGLQLLKAIRIGRTLADRNLPCAMLTSYAERHLVGLAIVLDVDTFLAKPVSLETLAKHMHRMFQYRFEPQAIVDYDAIEVDNVAPHLTGAPPKPAAPPQPEAPELLPVDERQLEEQEAAKAQEALAAVARRARPEEAPERPSPAKPAPVRSEPAKPAAPARAPAPAPRELSGTAVRVALSEVPENAVLARDLVGAGGTLLLAAGTPFKRRYMKRLEELSAINEAADFVWILER